MNIHKNSIFTRLKNNAPLTFQESRILGELEADFFKWQTDLKVLEKKWSQDQFTKNEVKKLLQELSERHSMECQKGPNYSCAAHTPLTNDEILFSDQNKEIVGLGHCPVNSQETRCCQLYTLDAVVNCSYQCSYCSISHMANGDHILFDRNLEENLKKIKLDPNKKYHIGTGQASDSLLYGNRNHLLDVLLSFAKDNPNIILEFKTKSACIEPLLNKECPSNLLVTWSLNSEEIVLNEEIKTATVQQRLEAAQKARDKNIPIGFHFHPMVRYEGWQEGYNKLFQLVKDKFSHEDIVNISIGTLTFTKKVINAIRKSEKTTQILKMPMEASGPKLSYPEEIKAELFSFCYQSFKKWHDKIFFYLCMEPHSLWKKSLGFEWEDNDQFEKAMINSYFEKCYQISQNGKILKS